MPADNQFASFILIFRPLNFLPSMDLIILLAAAGSISIHEFISFISMRPSTSFEVTHIKDELQETGFIKTILGAEVDKQLFQVTITTASAF